MKITGYLFDIDGTLLDSRPAHTRAWQRTLAAHEILKKESEIHYDFSATDPDVVRSLFNTASQNLIDQISREKNDFFLEDIPNIPRFPKVFELLDRIHADHIPICFVSSNYDRILGLMMEAYGWDEISIGFVGIDAVTHAKPDPEMVNLAIKKICRKPNECVMVGDSPADIKAGKAAGTRTIAVSSMEHSPESFKALHPDKILTVIGDLLPLLPLSFDYFSPPFRMNCRKVSRGSNKRVVHTCGKMWQIYLDLKHGSWRCTLPRKDDRADSRG